MKHNNSRLSVRVRPVIAACVVTLFVAGCQAIKPFDQPEPAEIETSVFLLGDAGEPNPREIGAPLDTLTAHASVSPERNVIIFLGDNIYPDGLPEEGHAEWADARRRLEAQVLAVPMGVRGIFLPGNHDWAGTKPFGLYSIRLQEQMIRRLARGRDVRMLPGNGCPGPVTFDAGRFRFIAMDTQWWLHEYIVKDSATNCPTQIGQVTRTLRDQIQSWQNVPGGVVVVGGHHPMMTGGEHGAYCGITGPFRRFGNRSQDIVSKLNRTLRDSMESAFTVAPPLAYAAGHDHNQQVLRGGEKVKYLLVTGAATKVACAVRLRESFFTSQHRTGFMRLDIMKGSGVLLRVYHYDSRGEGGLAYSQWLEAR
jgi:hypothetical protein